MRTGKVEIITRDNNSENWPTDDGRGQWTTELERTRLVSLSSVNQLNNINNITQPKHAH